MFSTVLSRIYHLCLALLLALLLCLLSPQTSKAYAVLLRSDPPANAVLRTEPVQVRLWFSEHLDAASSTASVFSSLNQRVDVNGGLVLPTDAREMDIALRPGLLPGVYVVVWHTRSLADGQTFSGAFPFSIADASGSVPASGAALPYQDQFAASSAQINGVTLFRWLMSALSDLCVIFWISGKVWHIFVLDPAGSETTVLRAIAQQSQQRFTLRYSLPILRVLFLANLGVLAGQALSLGSGRWDLILSPALLVGLLTNGNFGICWLIGEVVIALAIMLETMVLFSRQHAPDSASNDTSSWLDLLLCLLLLIITTCISYVPINGIMPTMLTLLVGGVYLLAAILWIGGLFYLSLVYLPILRDRPSDERALSLLATLQRFSPLALSAAIIMLLSGVYNAVVRQTSFIQLPTPVYGLALIAQIVCIIVLLVASVLYYLLLQPALIRDYERCERSQQQSAEPQESEVATKVQEQNLLRLVNWLTIALRYTLLPCVIVILCMALLSVLGRGF